MADDENQGSGVAADGGGKKSSAMGPILALLGVTIIGAVLVVALVSLLGGSDQQEDDQTTNSEDRQSLIERAKMLSLGDVMANVKGEEGRRYVKVTVDLWYPKDQAAKVEDPNVKNLMIEATEQRLATFDMKELNNEFVHTTMARNFEDQINKTLREVYGSEGTDTSYVDRIVLTNLLIQ